MATITVKPGTITEYPVVDLCLKYGNPTDAQANELRSLKFFDYDIQNDKDVWVSGTLCGEARSYTFTIPGAWELLRYERTQK